MGTDEKSLSSMTRDELEAYAAECGVADPSSYGNMDELKDAIEAQQAQNAPQGETLAEPMAAPAPGFEDEAEAPPPNQTDEGQG